MTEYETEIIISFVPKDVEIHIKNTSLKVLGKKCTEENFERFEQIIPLPAEVKPDAAKAEFKNGMLRIILPKIKTHNILTS